ncbi:MAG: hypothetical protein ABIH23_27445 [bacterium]
MKGSFFVSIGVLFLVFCMVSGAPVEAQVSQLEGAWVIEDGTDGTEFSPATINTLGRMTFTEVFSYRIGEQDYVFDINYTGQVTYNESKEFAFVGIGIGMARESNGTVTARIEAAATGIGSADNVVLTGIWLDSRTFTTPDGETPAQTVRPVILVREGADIPTPGAVLAGTWQITLTSTNFEWSGEVTLNPDGSMLGEYSSLSGALVPLAGLFTYSETKEFSLTYTTTTELPVLGETTFTLSGEGQGNEDNTEISGTRSFTVQVTDRTTQTFEGTFVLKKIASSGVLSWDSYKE